MLYKSCDDVDDAGGSGRQAQASAAPSSFVESATQRRASSRGLRRSDPIDLTLGDDDGSSAGGGDWAGTNVQRPALKKGSTKRRKGLRHR